VSFPAARHPHIGERITVRVIKYSVVDDEGVAELPNLIMVLLDPQTAPAIELAGPYADRWTIELLYRVLMIDLCAPPRRSVQVSGGSGHPECGIQAPGCVKTGGALPPGPTHDQEKTCPESRPRISC
jgi:hypothetical protein